MLNIEKTNKDGIIELALEGRLDSLTAPQLEDAINQAVPEAKGLILDFMNLKYISSAGIRVLLYTLSVVKFDSKIVIKNSSKQVEQVMNFVGVSPFFSMQQDH